MKKQTLLFMHDFNGSAKLISKVYFQETRQVGKGGVYGVAQPVEAD